MPANVVTFTEEIINGKRYFSCSVSSNYGHWKGFWMTMILLVSSRENLDLPTILPYG